MGKIFRVQTLVTGVVCFALFMVLGCGAYYVQMGVFVSAQLAIICAALALAGALGVMLRFYRFSVSLYAGCAGAYLAKAFIGTLEGEFAPTAGTISAAFLIAAFALLGISLEVGRLRRQHRKKVAAREEERAREAAEAAALSEPDAPEAQSVPPQDGAPEPCDDAAAVSAAQAAPSAPTDNPFDSL